MREISKIRGGIEFILMKNFIDGFCISTNNDAYKFLAILYQEQTSPEKLKCKGQDIMGSQRMEKSFNDHSSSVLSKIILTLLCLKKLKRRFF